MKKKNVGVFVREVAPAAPVIVFIFVMGRESGGR